MDTYLNVLLLVGLIMLSGFFSASETALTAFRSIHLEKLEGDKDNRKYKLLKNWLKNPNEMLTGILIGNNVVNILASSIATVVTMEYLGKSKTTVMVATACVTIGVLIFGEITPKIIARNNSFKIAKTVIIFISVLTFITKPIIKILIGVSNLIGRIIGIDMENTGVMMTEEDLISFVNVGESEGVIEEEEKEMIHSIVTFGDTTAKEVMTPRTSVLLFEENQTFEKIWDQIIEKGFSRIPVYRETVDNIIGVLYVKDILKILKAGKIESKIKDYIRPAYFVPETKHVADILAEFKVLKVHIAVVLDEYGGTVGVLTIEDLIEEIVGEIRDEFDSEEDEFFKKISDNTYEVDAMIDIETVNKEFDLYLPISEDYESLGGLLMSDLGRIAEVGDEIKEYGVSLKVLTVENKRISKVLMTILNGEVELDG